MRLRTLQLAWHGQDPVLSADFAPQRNPNESQQSYLLATGGADNSVRLWRFFPEEAIPNPSKDHSKEAKEGKESNRNVNMGVSFIRTLDRHEGAVNVVRFAPMQPNTASSSSSSSLSPLTLATAGDDRVVLLWDRVTDPRELELIKEQKKASQKAKQHAVGAFADDLEEDDDDDEDYVSNGGEITAMENEFWRATAMLRGHHSDVYDLSWSPDGRFLVSGSTDNSAIVWDVIAQRKLCQVSDHMHYVQGVAWAPPDLLSAWRAHIAAQAYRESLQSPQRQQERPSEPQQQEQLQKRAEEEQEHHHLPRDDHPSVAQQQLELSVGPASPQMVPDSEAESPPPVLAMIQAADEPTTIAETVVGAGASPPAKKQKSDLPRDIVVTLSSDQTMRVYDVRTDGRGRKDLRAKCRHVVRKRPLPGRDTKEEPILSVGSATELSGQAANDGGAAGPVTAVSESAVTVAGAGKTSGTETLSSAVLDMPDGNSRKISSHQKNYRIFVDESLQSFYRRLSWTPDGSALIVPSGVLALTQPPQGDSAAGLKLVNCFFVFGRGQLDAPVTAYPVSAPPRVTKAAVCVRCCSQLFQLRNDDEMRGEERNPVYDLPWRVVFAVATLDAVLLFDTQRSRPFGVISGIHYAPITDMTWTPNGSALMVTSRDGYCSAIVFDPGELGEPFDLSPLDLTAELLAGPSSSSSSMPATENGSGAAASGVAVEEMQDS